jgi:hypothetical protein
VLRKEARFCPRCGQSVDDGVKPLQLQKPAVDATGALLALVIVAAMILLMLLFAL